MEAVSAILEKNFSSAIKALDAQIKKVTADGRTHELEHLLCNQGLCYQGLDMFRKAVKAYDEALKANPQSLPALVRKGKALYSLGKEKDAKAAWTKACEAATPASDFQLLLEAQALLRDPTQALLAPSSSKPTATAAAPTTPGFGSAPGVVTTATPPLAANGTVSLENAATAASIAERAGIPVKAASPAAAQNGAGPSGSGSPSSSSASNGLVKASRRTPSPGRANGNSAIQAGSTPFDVDDSAAVSIAVNLINEGNLQEAQELLDGVIKRTGPGNVGAHVARGTARAMLRELQGAVDDFSVAIQAFPAYGDAWKRRGQAKSALGDTKGALEDLQKSIELAGMNDGKAEAYVERAMIFQKEHDYRRAVSELQKAVRLKANNAQAWNMLGLCRTSQGDIRDGIEAYERAVKLDPQLREAWINMAQARKEIGDVARSERDFATGTGLNQSKGNAVHGLRVLAQMRQGCGDHMRAVDALTDALADATEAARIDCLFLRGACWHAMGYHQQAVEDYDKAFSLGLDRLGALQKADGQAAALHDESCAPQFLAFYQRECALYVRALLDKPVDSFCPDRDWDPNFKELWCKKAPPSTTLIRDHRPQPRKFSRDRPPPPDRALLDALIAEADKLGRLLQYSHQGFLPNKRQQRMGGLAAIELAQAVLRVLDARRSGESVSVPDVGASGRAMGGAGSHAFGWRDVMDISVKWRQLAEPNDQVLWVDMLTTQEFEAGFGSHTPMYSGQTKCVRYYMNFARGMAIFKDVLAKEGRAFNAQNNAIPLGSEATQRELAGSNEPMSVWRAIGEDCWVVVPIASASREGHSLEGTRLTLVRLPNQPDAYEFSIRTPVTPPRWDDYELELAAQWDAVLMALEAGDLPGFAQSALRFVYYWYNFMPLARGTAAVGYITLLGLFMAAGAPITASIPKDYQTDWEAILARSPAEFIASVLPWLCPPAARPADPSSSADPTPAANPTPAKPSRTFRPPRELPAVAEVLNTMRRRLEALNGPDMPRI